MGPTPVTGAQAHAARKELAATERRMDRLSTQMEALHERMAAHDQADYVGLQELTEELRGLEAENETLEERWLELSELLNWGSGLSPVTPESAPARSPDRDGATA